MHTPRWSFRARLHGSLTAAAAALLCAAGIVAAAGAQARAADSGWQPKTPPLTTPWTSQVSPSNDHPEYPRPQLTRPRWENLNGVWQFAAASPGDQPPSGTDLPGRILVPFPEESALSGIMRHDDYMWYRRTFTVPANWGIGGSGCTGGASCPRLLLHFGAVDWRAAVYVNGQLVTTHQGGYDSFTADVTGALRRGPDGRASGPQELIVGVYDPVENGALHQPIGKQRAHPGGIFYTSSSGIWQTVWMEPVPAAHIDSTTGDYTVAAWVKLDRLGSFATAVSQDGDFGESEFFLQYSGADNRFAMSTNTGRALASFVPQTGVWYHLVGVRDSAHNLMKLYVDGQLAGTLEYCPGNAAHGDLVIGRALYGGNHVDFWPGAIDQVHVYDRALSDQEVQQLYQSGL